MAFRRFVTIAGKRLDITDVDIIPERVCDRCGRYMTHWTSVAISADVVTHTENDVPVELCDLCIREHFPGLIDLAVKVTDHA